MVDLDSEFLSVRGSILTRRLLLPVQSVNEVVDRRLPVAIMPELLDESPSASIGNEVETRIEADGRHDVP
jgi:hypothetical protein